MGSILLLFILYAITAAVFNAVRWMWRRLRELRELELKEQSCQHSPVEVDGRLRCVHCGEEL